MPRPEAMGPGRNPRRAWSAPPPRGFTLIEMVVTLALLAILAAAARPVLELAAQRQREHTLREALRSIRTALDGYERAVRDGTVPRPEGLAPGLPAWPPSLEVLVEGVPTADTPGAPRLVLLRRLPRDPFAPADLPAAQTWALRSSDSPPDDPRPGRDVFDVRSRAAGTALDGSAYRDW